MEIRFDAGTLVLDQVGAKVAEQLPGVTWDPRVHQWRAAATNYRAIILGLQALGCDYQDRARSYQPLDLSFRASLTPRGHQAAALRAWVESGRRGVIQLPTGAGKTILALMAMVQVQRNTLVVVPTIDLLRQWGETINHYLGYEVATLGGGFKEIGPVTVATYDSAALMIEKLGPQFGLIVVDECHHLPSPQYRNIALGSVAPFRLGLSATVQRADGKEEQIFDLLGPLVFEAHVDEMPDNVLSPYDVVQVNVELSDEERIQYQKARSIYTGFLRQQRIRFSSPSGWQEFIRKSTHAPGGRAAMRAYLEQKRISQASSAKISQLWEILEQHREDRAIIFTADNALAYRIGERFVLPVLTHQTRLKERKRMLAGFGDGSLSILVTSKVLNEGVDVPEANVGVVVSGSGSIREHVQRLGRILRHRPGKRAVLYEIVSGKTSEYYVNRRRKQHRAYSLSSGDKSPDSPRC